MTAPLTREKIKALREAARNILSDRRHWPHVPFNCDPATILRAALSAGGRT